MSNFEENFVVVDSAHALKKSAEVRHEIQCKARMWIAEQVKEAGTGCNMTATVFVSALSIIMKGIKAACEEGKTEFKFGNSDLIGDYKFPDHPLLLRCAQPAIRQTLEDLGYRLSRDPSKILDPDSYVVRWDTVMSTVNPLP